MIQGSHPTESVFADIWNALQQREEFDQGINALAGQVSASEFEVSAALRILEREGKIARAGRGEGRYRIQLTPKARQVQPHAADAKALLAVLLEALPVEKTTLVQLSEIARRAQLPEALARHALGLLEKSGAANVRRPFAGRTIRPLQHCSYVELELDLSRVREQEQ